MVGVNLLHVLDGIKEPNDKGSAERLARLDGPAAELLNQADVAALVAPGLGNHRRVKRHAGQPGAVLAGPWIAKVVSADKPLRSLALSTHVGELLVGRKILQEFAGGDFAKVTEIDLAKGIAVLVLDVAGHIDAQEHGIAGVDAGDTVAGEEVAFAGREDDGLRPARPR